LPITSNSLAKVYYTSQAVSCLWQTKHPGVTTVLSVEAQAGGSTVCSCYALADDLHTPWLASLVSRLCCLRHPLAGIQQPYPWVGRRHIGGMFMLDSWLCWQ